MQDVFVAWWIPPPKGIRYPRKRVNYSRRVFIGADTLYQVTFGLNLSMKHRSTRIREYGMNRIGTLLIVILLVTMITAQAKEEKPTPHLEATQAGNGSQIQTGNKWVDNASDVWIVATGTREACMDRCSENYRACVGTCAPNDDVCRDDCSTNLRRCNDDCPDP